MLALLACMCNWDRNVQTSGMYRERKRANDLKAALDECKHRLDTTLRDQRLMARKVRSRSDTPMRLDAGHQYP